uniref:Uncharacterized protein n=1 Tax=Tetradesmus obliquus TaxID=3088 RepID=A0A383VMF5_TETOB|eukprot:jgi/Sobl393_1/15454/SZX65874.1
MNCLNARTVDHSWSGAKPARQSSLSKASRRLTVQVNATVHARWCLDVRYGCKTEATALLQEWVATVGSKAGLTAANTRLASGCLGVPESRLEMEVSFDSMADWEAFLSSVPFQEHKAWTQRIQSMVVDGSPVWQVHRSVPLAAASSSSAAAVAAAAGDRAAGVPRASRSSGAGGSSTAGSGNGKLVITDEISLEDIAAWHEQQGSSFSISEQPQRRQPAAVPADDSSDDSSSSDGPRDWKGDPMKLNPGDKLPFKFL